MLKDKTIKVSKLKQGDFLTEARLIYCADPASFIKAFSNIGIIIDPKDADNEMVLLANLHAKGKDTDGSMKNSAGNSMKIDLRRFVHNIQVNHAAINNCGMKLDYKN